MNTSAARATVAAVAATIAVGPATAGFTNLVVETDVVGAVYVHRIYAQFNSSDDVVLSFEEIADIDGPFFHFDAPGGTFAPQFTTDPTTDSYVTIGGMPGFGNSTGVSGFPGGAFGGASIPSGASWFNLTPTNLQGKVDPVTHRTLIAQLAFTSSQPLWNQMYGVIKWNEGLGTPTQQTFALFFPAPSAVLPLVACAAFGRRRRGVAG